MEIFVKFCQLQTLSKTGRAIGLTAADVNNIIIGIEKNVGGPVYVRKVDIFTLTEKGEELLEVCNVMLDALEKLDVKKINKQSKTLTIAVTYWDAQICWPDILDEFMKKYPDATVNLVVGLEYTKFTDPACDIAIGDAMPNKPEIEQRFLLEHVVKLYASKNYLKTHGTPTSIRDLKNHRILNHTGIHSLPDSVFRNNNYVMNANSFVSVAEMLLKDQGIALLPKVMPASDQRYIKNCAAVLPELEVHRYGFFFLNRKIPEKSEMIETLFDLAVNKYNQLKNEKN